MSGARGNLNHIRYPKGGGRHPSHRTTLPSLLSSQIPPPPLGRTMPCYHAPVLCLMKPSVPLARTASSMGKGKPERVCPCISSRCTGAELSRFRPRPDSSQHRHESRDITTDLPGHHIPSTDLLRMFHPRAWQGRGSTRIFRTSEKGFIGVSRSRLF